MPSIYKPRAFTGCSKALWMCPTWCLTSVWLCMYLGVSVLLNLCTTRLLNLIWSRLWAWLEGIWDLDHKTQCVEPAWAPLGAWDVVEGRWCRVELVPPGSHGTGRELGPALRAKPRPLRCIDTTTDIGWETTLPGWGSRKAPKSCFIPRDNVSFIDGDKWKIN